MADYCELEYYLLILLHVLKQDHNIPACVLCNYVLVSVHYNHI